MGTKTCKVNQDTHGLYIKNSGYVFRPVFPMGFDPKNPDKPISSGDEVKCYFNSIGDGSYARVTISDGTVLYWMKHGSYIVPKGDGVKHIKSDNVYLNK